MPVDIIEDKQKTYTFKTYLESNRYYLGIVESKIRAFCFSQNVEIITLNKDCGWVMGILYIHLKGKKHVLESIKNYIMEVASD